MGRTEVTGTFPDKCGHPKKNRGGGPCGLTAGYGTEHLGVGCCKFHGGNSPSHLKKAARTIVLKRMEAAYGDLVDLDPGAALLQEVQRSAGIVQWIGAIVRDFTKLDLDEVSQKEARKAALEQTAFNGWQAAAWVDLFYRERKHLAMVAKMALDAGVAERAIKIEEEKMALVADAINGIFKELELTAEQRAIFPGVARRHLQAIGSSL